MFGLGERFKTQNSFIRESRRLYSQHGAPPSSSFPLQIYDSWPLRALAPDKGRKSFEGLYLHLITSRLTGITIQPLFLS
jgi:hypothetical protein